MIRGRTYGTAMNPEDIAIYKEKTRLLEEFRPRLEEEFADLNSSFGSSMARLGVPESVAKRILSNEESLYTNYIKLVFEAEISNLYKTYMKSVADKGESVKRIGQEAEKIYKNFSDILKETKMATANAASFDELAAIAYEGLKDRIHKLSGLSYQD
jgi:hypothetical protein